MKTLAQFKRDAASGKIALELVERFGSTEFPERMRGIRKIARVNTVGITLVNERGEDSYMSYGESAKLFEYDGDTLTIYKPAMRPVTEQERQVRNEYEKIRAEYYKNNPWGDDFWKQKDYYAKSACPWMYPNLDKSIKGKKYMLCDDLVQDEHIRGEAILKYRVHAVA